VSVASRTARLIRYERTAYRFLSEQALRGDVLDLAALTGADVNAFLLRECARVPAGSAKGRVAELRTILRFLYLQGLTPLQLGGAVPPVGGSRLATIPRLVSATQVQAVIDSCDAGTMVGARDRAIMLLAARLGLRSVEVARLELDDIDWRHGELTVRGKARREDRLPLPAEVGQAVSDYLACRGRIEQGRRVFVTCRAPHGPIRPDLVNGVIKRGCKRAGA
jgi:integrase